jgi:hypothetical protein
MRNRLKISHRSHTGKYRPHEYTSYGPLMFLMLVTGVALTIGTVSASPGPAGSSVGLAGIMPGPAPTIAATIDSPTTGQHFTKSPITVSGTCPKDTLVELYKNNIFAGSTTCSSGNASSSKGTYSISVDLLIGKNALVARVYNALNEPGPDSNTVTVYYDILPPQGQSITSLNFGNNQLLLSTNAVYRGTDPGQKMTMPIGILGGTEPYAVNVQWGDSSNKIVPRNNNLTFNVEHTYNAPGTYQITLQGSDAQGRVAFLSVAAIVNGQPAATGNTSTKNTKNKLLLLWPLYTSAVATLLSFWLGERREKRIIGDHMLRPHFQV